MKFMKGRVLSNRGSQHAALEMDAMTPLQQSSRGALTLQSSCCCILYNTVEKTSLVVHNSSAVVLTVANHATTGRLMSSPSFGNAASNLELIFLNPIKQNSVHIQWPQKWCTVYNNNITYSIGKSGTRAGAATRDLDDIALGFDNQSVSVLRDSRSPVGMGSHHGTTNLSTDMETSGSTGHVKTGNRQKTHLFANSTGHDDTGMRNGATKPRAYIDPEKNHRSNGICYRSA